MSKSRRSSIASAPCRIEWRPSGVAAAALAALAVLGPLALTASNLPRELAWPLALAAAAWGVHDTRRYLRQPRQAWVLPPGGSPASCDGQPVEGACIAFRGPLAVLRWRSPGGGWHRRMFWPDVLDAPGRRELRVAAMQREAAPDRRSMAG
jgi:toxin CptA